MSGEVYRIAIKQRWREHLGTAIKKHYMVSYMTQLSSPRYFSVLLHTGTVTGSVSADSCTSSYDVLGSVF